MKDIILPEIMTNKDKLNKKMKEKKSYVKIVNQHIQETNFNAVKNSEERKRIVSQLIEQL